MYKNGNVMKKFVWLFLLGMIGTERVVVGIAGEGALASSGLPEVAAKDRAKEHRVKTKDELAQLLQHDQEPVMNLVIINDVLEVNSLLTEDNSVEAFKKLSEEELLGAMTGGLLNALLEDQLVMCPRLLWKHIADIGKIINLIFINIKIKNPLFLHYSTDQEEFMRQFGHRGKFINNLGSPIQKMGYEEALVKGVDFYKNFTKGTIKTVDDLVVRLESILENTQEDALEILGLLYYIYISYNLIIAKNYACKQLTDDFILFIPQKKLNDFNQNLKNYDYKNQVDQLVAEGELSEIDGLLGQKLIEALKVLRDNIQVQIQQLFVNCILHGHGSHDFIASLSIRKNSQESSDFINFVNFLNNEFRTKTLFIVSCFVGGRKNIEAYNIDMQYSNNILNYLKYVVINSGVTFKPVFALSIKESFRPKGSLTYKQLKEGQFADHNEYDKYFSAINEIPANYKKVFNSKLISNSINNFITIKLPNTSWFTPVQYDKSVMTLSQIAMLARKDDVVISEDVKVVLLGANYIPWKLKINANIKDLNILPSNYHNQNYYIKACVVKGDLDTSIDELAFMVDEVEEPMNIFFEEFTILNEQDQNNNKTIKNLCFFSWQNPSRLGIDYDVTSSGYVYVDENGEQRVFILYVNEEDVTENIETIKRENHEQEYLKYVEQVKQKAMEALPTAFKHDVNFAKTLSEKLIAKDQTKEKIERMKINSTMPPKAEVFQMQRQQDASSLIQVTDALRLAAMLVKQ